jgi:hypothetical protein
MPAQPRRPRTPRTWVHDLLRWWPAVRRHRREPAPSLRAQVLADYHADTTRQAREATIALVRAGFHIGAIPYGYRTRRVRAGSAAITPPPGLVNRRRLVPDPVTAAVVAAIFWWRVEEHLSATAIAARLAADPRHCPPPLHPATGRERPWTARMVLAMLSNPVYTGRTVWGRTDHRRHTPVQGWITSAPGAHRALVDDRTFARAAAITATVWHAPGQAA